jgi:hypothetical protein
MDGWSGEAYCIQLPQFCPQYLFRISSNNWYSLNLRIMLCSSVRDPDASALSPEQLCQH